jgi:hypothetical protein
MSLVVESGPTGAPDRHDIAPGCCPSVHRVAGQSPQPATAGSESPVRILHRLRSSGLTRGWHTRHRADAGGGLVGADHRTGAHRIGNRCRGGQQRRLGAGQDIGDRVLTDDQTEHFDRQAGETLEADRLGDVKMDQRTQSRPERRDRLEPLRRRRRDVLPATGTDAAMAVDAGDGRVMAGNSI